MKEINLSYSTLRDYMSCPLLFYFRKYLRLQLPDKSIHLEFGSAIHKGLELHEAEGKDPLKVFKKEFRLEILNDEDQLKYHDFVESAERVLGDYKIQEEDIKEMHDIEITKTEEYFKIENPVAPDGTKLKFKNLTGVVDLITKDKSLGDYKTSSKKYKQAEVDESLQPTFYYFWYWLTYGELPNRFLYIIFLKKHKTDKIQVLETTRTLEDINKLVHLANEVYTKVESKQFERGHDDHAWCDCFKYEELLEL